MRPNNNANAAAPAAQCGVLLLLLLCRSQSDAAQPAAAAVVADYSVNLACERAQSHPSVIFSPHSSFRWNDDFSAKLV